MRTTRIILVIGALLLLLVGVAAFVSSPFLQGMAGVSPEQRAFRRIQVGEAEQALVATLDQLGVEYGKETNGGGTTYTHSDGLFGVRIYHVVDGKVKIITTD